MAITGEFMGQDDHQLDQIPEPPVNIDHDSKGRFVKGHKGSNHHTVKDKRQAVILYCQGISLEMARIAASIARKTKASDGDRLRAVNAIQDRAHGRPEAAVSTAGGMFQGATIIVDTGIRRRALEGPVIDETGRVDGQDGDKAD